MRVLHRDPKTGEIKLRVENADDLWHLHNLVQPGDLVRASTYRRGDVKTDKVRPERGEKVRVTLTVRVEGVEFQALSDRLRITGVIVEGPQDLGRHHTLNVAPEDVLSVIKIWRPHELRRIEEAVAAAQKPLVSFLSLDDEEALLAHLRQYGVKELATIRAPAHGKMFPSGDTASVFFDEILGKLRLTEIGEAAFRAPDQHELPRRLDDVERAPRLEREPFEDAQGAPALSKRALITTQQAQAQSGQKAHQRQRNQRRKEL